MHLHFLAAGIALLAVTAGDFAYTTISANRSGPLTRLSADSLWRLLRRLARLLPGSLAYRLAGPVIMSGVACLWLLLTSLAWLLIFRTDPGSLVMKSSGEDADWLQTYAFIGSALSTVGASNARPSNAIWDNLSMVIAVNGMIVLTLSVTFVLNVTQSVARGRGLSALLRVRDPAKPENDDLLLPALADLCVRLNASPLALYYSSQRAERSLPESLDWLANRVAGDPDRFSRYRYLLHELPYMPAHQTDDPVLFLKEIRTWSQRFSLPRENRGA